MLSGNRAGESVNRGDSHDGKFQLYFDSLLRMDQINLKRDCFKLEDIESL